MYWANTYGFDPWDRIPARVRVDGSLADAKVFVRRGVIAVALREEPRLSWPIPVYTFHPTKPDQIIVGGYYHRQALGRLWVKPQCGLGLLMLPGGYVKTEVDPHVRFKPGHLEFTSMKHQRVNVDY